MKLFHNKSRQWIITFTLLLVCATIVLAESTVQLLAEGYFVSTTGLTPTAGNLAIADGTSFKSVTMSGGATINSSGVITITGGGSFPVSSSGAGTPVILTSASSTITGAGNTVAGGSGTLAATLTSGTNNVLIGSSVDVGTAAAASSVAIGNTAVAPTGGVVIGSNAGKAGASANQMTIVGNGAGSAVTTAGGCSYFGYQAGKAAAGGNDQEQTFIGAQAGVAVNGSMGYNTFVGGVSGLTCVTGNQNCVFGADADLGASTASNAVSVGYTAVAPTGGTVIGNAAGKAGATAARFTAIGNTAGGAITNGADNTFVGDSAGAATTSVAGNTFIGSSAGKSNIAGVSCTYVGFNAGLTAVGTGNDDSDNTFIGKDSGKLANGSTAGRNTCLGFSSGAALTTGSRNALLGEASGLTTLTTGTGNTFIGTDTDANTNATSNAILIGTGSQAVIGSSTSVLMSVHAITSAVTNDLYIGSGDTGFNRVAAGVIQPNTGNGGTTAAWLQQSAGSSRLAADYTNATAGFTNTLLSITVTTGRVYSFHAVLFYANSTAAEGAQFDFGGGGATSTNFVAGTDGFVDTVTTSLTGVFTQGTVTGNQVITIDGTFEPSSTGTFIIRGAEVSHATGTLTIKRGSYIAVRDMP